MQTLQKSDILQFIINNDKVEVLKAKLNKFNPFKILKLQDQEIRHSNVLGWIFNPNENHNLDDRFLKRFVLNVIIKPENDAVQTNVQDIYKLNKISFQDFKVFREKHNIDLLIASDINRIVFLIENKINSSEHSNQLEKYLDIIEKEYPGYEIIPIYLTIEGVEASNKKYFNASYEDILEVLKFVIQNYSERTSEKVIEFLEFYQTILKEKYFMDDDMRALCKEIYLENKEVIDLIYAVGNELDIQPAIPEFNSQFDYIEPVRSGNRFYWFIHKSFKKARKTNEDWGAGYPVCLWFHQTGSKLKIILEIGPFDLLSKRVEFIKYLLDKGIKIKGRFNENGGKYTRIFTETQNINDWEDMNEVSNAMIFLYKNVQLKQIEALVIDAINEFDWSY